MPITDHWEAYPVDLSDRTSGRRGTHLSLTLRIKLSAWPRQLLFSGLAYCALNLRGWEWL